MLHWQIEAIEGCSVKQAFISTKKVRNDDHFLSKLKNLNGLRAASLSAKRDGAPVHRAGLPPQ
jgi:hypothetical protein